MWIWNGQGEVFAIGCSTRKPEACQDVCEYDSKQEQSWHRQFGHLNEQSMKKVVKIEQLDYDMSG